MDGFINDYICRTVGESITKYNVSDDWCAEFEVYDSVYPIICIPVNQLRKKTALMELKLRHIADMNQEYAGCIVLTENKLIAFKVASIDDFENAMDAE